MFIIIYFYWFVKHLTNITWNQEHEFTILYDVKEKKKKTKQAIFNRFMNGHIQLVLSWWAGILLLACKQLAFVLQFSLWYPFTQRQKCFCTYEPFSATNFLLISCPMVPRQKRRGKEHVSSFSLCHGRLCHQLQSIIYSILGLTWHEVLTVERICIFVRGKVWASVICKVDDVRLTHHRSKREKERSPCSDRFCVIIFAEQQNPTEQSE